MSSIKHHVTGLEYWRSLEQLADSPEIQELVDKEFPGYTPDFIKKSSRRGFLKLMSASLALAGVGLTGCRRWPREKLAPYSSNPRDRMVGIPEQYATIWEQNGVGKPLLVTSYDGRPIKIEGNPSHPFSWTIPGKIGSADTFAQASVLELYDNHRSRNVIDRSRKFAEYTSWDDFTKFANQHFGELKSKKGEGFAVLSEASVSPSFLAMKKRFQAAFPSAGWYEYEALSSDNERQGAQLAFGKPVRSILHLDKAQVAVLLDADVLGDHPAHTRYAGDWAVNRRSADNKGADQRMSRVYIAESAYSLTGTNADVRIGVDPSRLYHIARAIATQLGVEGFSGSEGLTPAETKFVASAVKDLKEAKEKKAAVMAAGAAAEPHVHAVVHAINESLEAPGNTITFIDDPAGDRTQSHMDAIAELSQKIHSGSVTTLLMIGGNPFYDAPTDVHFRDALAKLPVSIHLSLFDDETSRVCKWHLPRAHYLEAWGDARSWDGSVTVAQPLIEPLYGGKSPIEVLALIAGEAITSGEQIVERTWKEEFQIADENKWRKLLADGILANSAAKPLNDVKIQKVDYPAPAGASKGMTLRFQADPRTFDGRFANNGWLQETPDPLTKLVWDNAVVLSKHDADQLGLVVGDMVRLTAGGDSLEVAVYVLPGQPTGVAGITVGYGRNAAGHIGDNLGFNAYVLRTSKTAYVSPGVKIEKLDKSYVLGMTQDHHLIDAIGQAGRDKRIGAKHESGLILHEATFAEYVKDPRAPHGLTIGRVGLQLFEQTGGKREFFQDTHAWGMSVDMSACIGCHACAVACQAENNIPIVGKHAVLNHREMNWIRIDRYFKGDPNDSNEIEVLYQPVMCQHCENAPCEQVCPVAATMHDSEGLNVMVYNRCIGTRYCSNNCPYKVRRFNYFDWHSQDPRETWGKPYLNIPDLQQLEQVDKIEQMQFNPEVSVRMRGVMEKCTYCIQRIHTKTQQKRAQGTDVVDGDIITACQQACPTQAIVFGNLLEKTAKVTQLHQNPRSYAMLDDELNTAPRTKYLAKLRNPVEEQEEKGKSGNA